MLYINELENSLDITLYENDKFKDSFIARAYKTELGSYDADINFISTDWDLEEYVEYDEFTPTSSARLTTFYDRITIDNLEGVFVDIMPIQNCLKSIIGYKGDYYRGFEVIFKRKNNICGEMESLKRSSRSLLKNKLDFKQVSLVLGKSYSYLNYYEYDFWDKASNVRIPAMYKIETPLSFTLEDFRVEGQVNMNIPCKISFTYFDRLEVLEVKVNNIIFYVEKNLKFTVNNKVANFEITAR
jgi:hypothetical protein